MMYWATDKTRSTGGRWRCYTKHLANHRRYNGSAKGASRDYGRRLARLKELRTDT